MRTFCGLACAFARVSVLASAVRLAQYEHMTERLHTAQAIADMLGKTKRTVHTNCKSGKWAHTKIGRSYYFTEAQLQALIDSGRKEPTIVLTSAERRARNKKMRQLLNDIV